MREAFAAPARVISAPALPGGPRSFVGEVSFGFGPRARRAFRIPKPTPTHEWAERHRRVTASSRPGPWRNENLPYGVGVFQAWDAPSVRDLVLCFAPQCGKTELELTCLASAIDQDPGPAMVVLDVESNAKDVSRKRILPMIQESPRLARHLSPASRDAGIGFIDLQTMPIYLAWATSVSALASKSIRYMIWDEIDKHAAPSAKEADPISLGQKRQRTYLHTRKSIYASSPTVEAGPIWRMFSQARWRFKFWARCPVCGGFQVMALAQLKWPEAERDPDRIRDARLAWYECEHCNARWDDFTRDRAVRTGEWMTEGAEPLTAVLSEYRPAKTAFHLSAFYSPFVPLGEIAAAFLASKSDPDKLKDFLNGYLAEPWVDYAVERSEDRILALRDDRPRGAVPAGTRALLAAVDTQDRGFFYEIRAFGEGLSSWQVREGEADSFEALDKLLFESRYRDVGGREFPVLKVAIDSQGHRTSEVYEWARRRPNVLPLNGQQRMAAPWRLSRVERFPGTNRAIPGGLALYHVNVTYYKDALSGRLEIHPADPGAWRLHAETGEGYARQMCAEYRDARGLWQCPKHKPNHYWDVSVYLLWLADMLGVANWKPEPETRSASAPSRLAVVGGVGGKPRSMPSSLRR